MPTHDTALNHVRVEVAFSSDPNTATPAFVDLTSRAYLSAGIDITRGRSEASGEVQAGSCNLTLDNADGALSPMLASSPYYPNVKPQNRIRVTHRDPSVAGNLVSANAASMETDASDWSSTTGFGAYTLCTVAQSAVRAWDGTKSLLITWPTTAGGSIAVTAVRGLVIGRTYTFSHYVYVPAGSPDVRMTIALIANGSTTAVKNAWTRISITWTATQSTIQVGPRTTGSTAGQQCWADGFQADEGSSAVTFTTTASPIVYRFDGYVDEWPVEWPSGGDSDSRSNVRAFDLQSRLSRTRMLGSVIAETYRLDGALWHFPLDELDGATSAGDRIGSGSVVDVAEIGTGGELVFGAGTGPGTDGASSPTFTPAPGLGWKYLYGEVPARDNLATGEVLEAAFLTSVEDEQTVARWSDVYGQCIELGIDVDGKATASFANPWNTSQNVTVTSSNVYADGRTHVGAVTISVSAGTVTLGLRVDGVATGAPATWVTGATFIYAFNTLAVGGSSIGRPFTGTISHVAGFGTALTTELADHYEAASGGFAGDRSDERIERIASWLGLPADLLELDAGLSTVGHSDPTGKSAWQAMQECADAEAGALFIGTTGAVIFHSRARSYDVAATVDASVSAEVIGPDVRLSSGIAGVANDITVTRSGGATVRAVDADSASTYGLLGESMDIISHTDADAMGRAEWELAMRSTPLVRLPELFLDGLTEPGSSEDVRRLDIGSRVEVTGLPAQAPESAADLRVQGYTERIGAGGWSLTANTTPYLPVVPLILDDATHGLLDTNRLAY